MSFYKQKDHESFLFYIVPLKKRLQSVIQLRGAEPQHRQDGDNTSFSTVNQRSIINCNKYPTLFFASCQI